MTLIHKQDRLSDSNLHIKHASQKQPSLNTPNMKVEVSCTIVGNLSDRILNCSQLNTNMSRLFALNSVF